LVSNKRNSKKPQTLKKAREQDFIPPTQDNVFIDETDEFSLIPAKRPRPSKSKVVEYLFLDDDEDL